MNDPKIIVCVSAAPSNARIIQTSAEIARSRGAQLIALYVETPTHAAISDDNRRRLDSNMNLASELGASTEIVYGDDIANRIAEYVHVSKADTVVIGQSVIPVWKKVFSKSLTDRLSALLPDRTLMIIPDVSARAQETVKLSQLQDHRIAKDILKAVFLLGAATLLGLLFQKAGLQDANIITLYILCVTLTSVMTSSPLAGVLNAAASVFVFNYLFTEPLFYFRVYDPGYMITFVVMFIAAFTTGTLASRLKEYAQESAKKAYRTQILLDASRLLRQEENKGNILGVTGRQLLKLTGRTILIYPSEDGVLGNVEVLIPDGNAGDAIDAATTVGPGEVIDVLTSGGAGDERPLLLKEEKGDERPLFQENGRVKGKTVSPEKGTGDDRPAVPENEADKDVILTESVAEAGLPRMSARPGDKEYIAASRALNEGRSTGAWTDVLSSSEYLFLPIRIHGHGYGVFGISRGSSALSSYAHSICDMIVGECALAMENEYNEKAREEAAVSVKNEQLRANLLRTISHDLRTPLTSIYGNADMLLSDSLKLDEETRMRIYLDIREDSRWLIRVVQNILSVTRLENKDLKLNRSVELMDDVIEEALRHIDREAEHRNIVFERSEEFLFAELDPSLIGQVIINLVNNAVKYSPDGSTILIKTTGMERDIMVSVSDNGPGVKEEDLLKIFDMFYTGDRKGADSRRGLGLGLSVSRSIVEAHGGKISARNRKPSGLEIRFTIPKADLNIKEDI